MYQYVPAGLLILLVGCEQPSEEKYQTWSSYLGGPDRNHYSTLREFTPENVDNLKIAWTYAAPDSGQMQMNPIIIDRILYGISAGLQVFALDAATGNEIWSYGDPNHALHSTSRGVAYWSDGKEDHRILFTRGDRLIALDADTGLPISTFGEKGFVDLRTGLPQIAMEKFIDSSTPGTIYQNLIIMPVRLSEGTDAAPGDIRAFDVRTGALVWTFHTIPYPGEAGYETWTSGEAYKNELVGAANNWAGMALDEETGVLYVPTGSASPDFYGGQRLGDNLFANCLLALDAVTGERIWHYQFVHHDLWDRDLPAPPNLITVTHNRKRIKAVAQITKQGYVFVFDRLNGEPLFEIIEQPVPPSGLAGEIASPTQPIPMKPAPFARQVHDLTKENVSDYAPNREQLLREFEDYVKVPYSPPGLQSSLMLPGYDGGAEWGGAAADPDEGILFVNANEMAWELRMEPTYSSEALPAGERLYIKYCTVCHQPDRKGLPASGYPSLDDIHLRLSRPAILSTIRNGKGIMAGFPQLSEERVDILIDFLSGKIKSDQGSGDTKPNLPYRHTGYKKWLDANGNPAIDPPWGTLHAIDLNTGEYIWSIPLGETPSLKEKGIVGTGTENYGGPVITSTGLLFIAGTRDGFFRAFDNATGDLLWEYLLPAPAFMTPSTYEVDGQQYIVVACGGEKLGTPKGNAIIAFSL